LTASPAAAAAAAVVPLEPEVQCLVHHLGLAPATQLQPAYLLLHLLLHLLLLPLLLLASLLTVLQLLLPPEVLGLLLLHRVLHVLLPLSVRTPRSGLQISWLQAWQAEQQGTSKASVRIQQTSQ
jgi:hypothetical protein